ncbi:sterol desaturase family protein [Aquabacterium sp. A7-Y]|uniref:sterol desaturase family protein n=1 Tax=Aquabacterium sp. A7-Y TaxID=1349605 RepID=UPI00223D4025|nr:sterol desaturase family protein [Aquabacterium sp. A7-Y]MCW7536780.1 sterol desaturase family protein [Aquabacterium sp. A7-Y]
MNPYLQNILIGSLILGFATMEFVSGRYRTTVKASGNDTKLELVIFIALVAIAQPIALLTTNFLCSTFIPEARGALSDLAWWKKAIILLCADDMVQYWYHRISHKRFLWPLHRAHHSARYMSIRMTYRGNLFYFLLMPGLWLSGVLVFLGFGQVFIVYVVIKQAVSLGAHSAWRWDERLYQIRFLQPLMWVLERTISTPATHWAHHAVTEKDGVGNYTGNFGNLLFIWDVIFGTARITRKYPEAVGLKDDYLFGEEKWTDQVLYPLSRSNREHSALRPGGAAYADD